MQSEPENKMQEPDGKTKVEKPKPPKTAELIDENTKRINELESEVRRIKQVLNV